MIQLEVGDWRMSEQTIKIGKRPPFINVFIPAVVASQIILIGGLYALTPGYIVPLLNNPIGRVLFIGCVIWEIIGLALLYIFCPRKFAIATAAFATIVSAGPLLLLLVLLSPLLVTYVDSPGPIMGGR
jgi:hypothetical protein